MRCFLFVSGPVQSQMQFPSGYGSHPPNYSAPSGHYSQVPSKAVSSHLDNQYRASYQSPYYSAPAQNVMTPPVGTNVLNTRESQQFYNSSTPPHTVGLTEGPAQGAIPSGSYVYTSAQQSYSAFGDHYNTSVSSSVASQGFPLNSDHYAMPVVSSAMYPNVSYPPAATSSMYGQAFTSQSLPAAGQFKETNTFSSQSTSVPHSLQQHVPVGYNSTLSTISSAQSFQDNLSKSLTGSVAKVNNQVNRGMLLFKGYTWETSEIPCFCCFVLGHSVKFYIIILNSILTDSGSFSHLVTTLLTIAANAITDILLLKDKDTTWGSLKVICCLFSK